MQLQSETSRGCLLCGHPKLLRSNLAILVGLQRWNESDHTAKVQRRSTSDLPLHLSSFLRRYLTRDTTSRTPFGAASSLRFPVAKISLKNFNSHDLHIADLLSREAEGKRIEITMSSYGPVIRVYTDTSNTTQVESTVMTTPMGSQCYFFRINHPTCSGYPGFYTLAVVITGLHWFTFVLMLSLLLAENAAGAKERKRNRWWRKASGYELFLIFACLGLLMWSLANTLSVFAVGVNPIVQYLLTGAGVFYYYMAAVQFVDMVLRTSPTDQFWARFRVVGDVSTLTRRSRMRFVREILLQVAAPILVGVWVLVWEAGGIINALTYTGGFPYLRNAYMVLTFIGELYLMIIWAFLLVAIILARAAWKRNVERAKDAIAFSMSQASSMADSQLASRSEVASTIDTSSTQQPLPAEIQKKPKEKERETAKPVAPTRTASYGANSQLANAFGESVSLSNSTSAVAAPPRTPSPRATQPNQFFSPIPTFAQQNPYAESSYAGSSTSLHTLVSPSGPISINGVGLGRRPSESAANILTTSQASIGSVRPIEMHRRPSVSGENILSSSTGSIHNVLASSQFSIASGGSQPQQIPRRPSANDEQGFPSLYSSSGSVGNVLGSSQVSISSPSPRRRPSNAVDSHGRVWPRQSEESQRTMWTGQYKPVPSSDGAPRKGSGEVDPNAPPAYGPLISALSTALVPQKQSNYDPDSGTFQRLVSPAWPVRGSWPVSERGKEEKEVLMVKALPQPPREYHEQDGRNLKRVLRRGQRTLDLLTVAMLTLNLFSLAYAVCLVYFSHKAEGKWPPFLYYFTLVVNYSLAMMTFLVIGMNNLGKLSALFKRP
ncbi:hypothetical protein BJ742DRAFT_462128 [Cladochytrium replicatum]|nr:hypothetical protein BJ742DRAFT_462128 [Cladochytrium replicatum]